MPKEILINVSPQEKRVAIVKDGRLEEYYIERPQDKTIVGNIYKGKIEAVMPSIGAAFVDIGLPKKGFLYLSEIENTYESIELPRSILEVKKEKGQTVLVQVVKEPFGNKGPRLTCNIGLAGRYLVLMPLENQIGVSRRIEDEEERRRLKNILQELKLPSNLGFIIRTAACGKTKRELSYDAYFLIKLWRRLEKTIAKSPTPSIIYKEYDLALRVIRDSFTEDVDRLIVDSKNEFYRLKRFMCTFLRHLTNRLVFYRGSDLFAEKDIERQINAIFTSKVYLKSKAYIVIEPTEGLVVIDVNSGGFKKKLEQEETAFRVNCEAAEEIAHQLRLRDLGGIIVIDFIDMEKESHRRQVLQTLKNALSEDKAKYDILGISKFGLVEMTRERIHNTVQTLTFQPCPYCQGRGRVKSTLTMSIYAQKEIKKFCESKRPREITITLNPLVVEEILKDKNNIAQIERQYRAKINIIPNQSFKIEDIEIA